MSTKNYDCIVIGAGIGGLIVSNMLSMKKMKVLLIEKNSFPGGFYSQIQIGKYEVDTAVSYFLSFENNGLLNNFFNSLTLPHDIKFIKLPIPDHYIFPDFEFSFTSDYNNLKSELCRRFPLEKENINTYFSILKTLYYSFFNIQNNYVKNLNAIILNYLNMDYFEFLDSIFSDIYLKAILSARAFGSKVSMFTMMTYLAKLIFEGVYQEMNNSNLAKLLEYSFQKNGGEILYNHHVDSVFIEGFHAKEVTCNGKKFQADHIISGCDMTKMYCSIIIPPIADNLKKALINKQKSLSSVSVFLILNKLPEKIRKNKAGRIYVYNHYDIKKMYEDKENDIFEINNGIKINTQGIMNDDLYDKADYRIRIEVDCSYNSPVYDPYQKEEIKNNIIKTAAKALGFDLNNIIDSKILLPTDFENLANTTNGAAAGWIPSPEYGDFTYFEKKVASNLYQTGSWDKHGSGIFPIFLSAKRVVRKISVR